MDKRVLVLGNGISRLGFTEFINGWPDELWACNYAFKEFKGRLDRLTGHAFVLKEAAPIIKKEGWKTEIWTGHIGKGVEDGHNFTCPEYFLKDSGSTLVAQALHEGYTEVYVAGFDLGGPDIHSPDLHLQDKSGWVKRWRKINQVYGLERVTFIGYDHKPFIKSSAPIDRYSKLYRVRKPHIKNEKYVETFNSFFNIEDKESMMTSRVAVKFLKGSKVGFISYFSGPVADVLEKRGKVKILTDAEVESEGKAPVSEVSTKQMKYDKLVDAGFALEDISKYRETDLNKLLLEIESKEPDTGSKKKGKGDK